MPNPKHTAYERLIDLAAEAETASYEWTKTGKSTEWRQNVESALRRLFGKDCAQLEAFGQVQYGPMMFSASTPDRVFHERFMDGIRTAQGIIRSAIQEYEDYEQELEHVEIQADSAANLPRRVFVVHGHDNEMKETVARFLEQLTFEVIILHEQANAGDTVIEKFERNADVSYAVVLLSPDDIGGSNSDLDKLKPRARQNVVLELGYFLGRLGRAKVCPLVRGPLEIPSDFHGVVYVPFEGNDWRIHLVKELKHLGFSIDANKAF